MKVFVAVNNYKYAEAPLGWYLLADSAVTNTGKPFYKPEFRGETVVSLSYAIRIGRLGKSIGKKFAGRYFSECAPSLHFTLPDLKEKLRAKGLPEDGSRNFDRSLFVGEFIPKSNCSPLLLKINGKEKASFGFENLRSDPEEFLSMVSEMNTIKIGDLLLPGLSEEFIINEGDLLEVFHEGEEKFHVKVK